MILRGTEVISGYNLLYLFLIVRFLKQKTNMEDLSFFLEHKKGVCNLNVTNMEKLKKKKHVTYNDIRVRNMGHNKGLLILVVQ